MPFSPDTLADTIWSFGVTIFGQRRFRDPEPSSWAFFLIPSVTYVICEQWNVSLGVEVMRRWFDPYLGFNEDEWFLEPIATLEFVLPASWFGSDRNARLFGRPAIDLQMAYEQNWSNIAAFSYGAWHVGAALKLGWRFLGKAQEEGLMAPEPTQKLSLFALTAMVVGAMVGAGIFSLPRTFAIATGPFGAIIAWCIAGTRHVHAGPGVPGAGRAQARPRRRRLRLCQGGLRRLSGLPVGASATGSAAASATSPTGC